ncbi:MAG: aminoacyl-tRNA hydrolase [wastewater metagenome]|nr:aminoacyl-tRNA hydrolase [Candidatus Loosdrechtia aerotolerans]
MKMIIGLGNPGERYIKTRHNIGFMVVDQFASRLGTVCNTRKFQSLFSKGMLESEGVALLKPQTFMNVSGVAVKEAIGMYKCVLQDLMVICDDLDLPLGKIRIKRGGGSGGHRGLVSIATHLGSADFPRLRVGIGRPSAGNPRDYVLSPFSKEEEVALAEVLEKACQALHMWILEGIDVCMNKFN